MTDTHRNMALPLLLLVLMIVYFSFFSLESNSLRFIPKAASTIPVENKLEIPVQVPNKAVEWMTEKEWEQMRQKSYTWLGC